MMLRSADDTYPPGRVMLIGDTSGSFVLFVYVLAVNEQYVQEGLYGFME